MKKTWKMNWSAISSWIHVSDWWWWWCSFCNKYTIPSTIWMHSSHRQFDSSAMKAFDFSVLNNKSPWNESPCFICKKDLNPFTYSIFIFFRWIFFSLQNRINTKRNHLYIHLLNIEFRDIFIRILFIVFFRITINFRLVSNFIHDSLEFFVYIRLHFTFHKSAGRFMLLVCWCEAREEIVIKTIFSDRRH